MTSDCGGAALPAGTGCEYLNLSLIRGPQGTVVKPFIGTKAFPSKSGEFEKTRAVLRELNKVLAINDFVEMRAHQKKSPSWLL